MPWVSEMKVQDLITTTRELAKNRTKEERTKLLEKAGIINKSGCYPSKYFSSETVKKGKNASKPKA
jgi:hypothetical protein